MIKIVKSQNPFVDTNIHFEKTLPSGRKITNYIEAKRQSKNDPSCINIPATGDLQLQDVPELIEAIKLAAKIANGEIID